ncbi:Hypothetical predicted protein [Pelobates cultripes]|uniref:Uncharacterized protein n=1 Tax=Pelobates cultripes TaxID=61616 RepID=A0AAD1W0T6_PELCU|nr:Hypothetical predicted protein [Pelobates cultripes]
MELNAAAHETQLSSLENKLQMLQREHILVQDRMSTMEDRGRWKNVKVRGLANNMDAAKIPHFFRRLLLLIFNAKQAKAWLLRNTSFIQNYSRDLQRRHYPLSGKTALPS